jgi:hypothetical protein
MAGFITYVSILTLNVSGHNSPMDIVWQSGLKRKIQLSVVTKRPTILTEINTGLRWKAGRFTKLMANENKQE